MYEKLHEKVAQNTCTNKLHVKVKRKVAWKSWRKICIKKLHEKVAQKICTKKLHEKVAWKSWQKKLHEKVAWKVTRKSCTKSYMKNLHEKLHEKVAWKFWRKVAWSNEKLHETLHKTMYFEYIPPSSNFLTSCPNISNQILDFSVFYFSSYDHFYSKNCQFSMNFHDNSKNKNPKNHKIVFSFVSAYCASFL